MGIKDEKIRKAINESDQAVEDLLSSEKKIKELDLPVLARIVDWTSFAQDPLWFTTAPVGAIKKLLKKIILRQVILVYLK